VTEAIVKQGIQGAWLPLDLLSTPERLKNENITVGDEIFLLGYPKKKGSSLLLKEKGVKSTIDPWKIKCYMLQHVTTT